MTFQPTPYGELNAVLSHLVGGARSLLGDNFIGAYLQGSFAVGDASQLSDCDFLIVTGRDISPGELPALQAFHAAIHRLPHRHWRNQLEGSYAPAAVLRRWSTTPRDPPGEARSTDWRDPGLAGRGPSAYPFLYLDHGSDRLVRSEHDNTQVVRWCLREKGVVLAGPSPRTLIDPVSPAMLAEEIRAIMRQLAVVGLEPMHLVAWQIFWVGLHCRMLHTLATGEVQSKPASLAWARETLDPRWRDLIDGALAVPKGAPEAEGPADPAAVAATRAFGDYVRAVASGSHPGGD